MPVGIDGIDHREHRKRRDGGRDAAEPHQNASECISDCTGEKGRQEQRDRKRQLVVRNDVGKSAKRIALHRRRYRKPCRGVGAQTHKADMAKADDARIANEGEETDHDHDADQHFGDGARKRAAREERGRGGDQAQGPGSKRPGSKSFARAQRASAHRHTLCLEDLGANRPFGLTSKVTITAP